MSILEIINTFSLLLIVGIGLGILQTYHHATFTLKQLEYTGIDNLILKLKLAWVALLLLFMLNTISTLLTNITGA